MVDHPTVPTITDPLAEALHYLRMDGMFYCRSEFTSPWGLELPEMPDSVWFHVVTAGRCLLVDSSGDQHHLRQGDVVVLPHGGGHRALDAPSSPTPVVFDLPHDYISRQYAVLRHGGGGEATNLICGVVRFSHPAARSLVQLLPDVIGVDAATTASDWSWLSTLMGLIASETRHPRPGSEAVVTRLCDILIIQAIRNWIDTAPEATTGWLGALRDPAVGTAIALMHQSPDRDWTVAELAAESAMSRSGFSARFAELVGESPVKYLTRWRMLLATELLSGEQMPVARVAARLGYGSEAAFSRAYKRVMGQAPSAVRRLSRHAGPATGSVPSAGREAVPVEDLLLE